MPKVYLGLVIHAHQPMGNFDHVIEEAYQKSYLPFVETLSRHKEIKMALHFTGSLLEWIKGRHPEYFTKLSELVSAGQIELVSGGFYEPILAILPFEDRCEQILKLNNFLNKELGYEPQGMWMAERVWESNLVAAIASSGIDYTILDDTHFRMAGLRGNELFNYYVTEEQGQTLKLVPSSMQVRYLVPFAEPEETIKYLRGLWENAEEDLLVAMGDDTEKFGVWPKTYRLCYTKGWLDRFYQAIAAESDWLETVKVGDYLRKAEPAGRIYLPTASYSEMLEWALPSKVAGEFVHLKHMLGDNELEKKVLSYMQGGYWRNFLVKYRESNLIHKKMLQVSRRARNLYQAHATNVKPAPSKKKGSTAPLPPLFQSSSAITLSQSDDEKVQKLQQAYDYLLQGQCNDAFWHGVFGGLYAPHLRSTLLMNLIKADVVLDEIEHTDQDWCRVREFDFDGDGINELELQSSILSAVYDNQEGGFSIIDLKPSNFALINSLQRQYEPYHDKIKQVAEKEAQMSPEELAKPIPKDDDQNESQEEVQTIHDIVKVKEHGLGNFLTYDKYPRNCFSYYILGENISMHNFVQQQLEGCRLLRGGDLSHRQENNSVLIDIKNILATKGEAQPATYQEMAFAANSGLIHNRFHAKNIDPSTNFAVEMNINLLAGDAHDRYFRFGDQQHRLGWQGEIKDQQDVELVDEYFRVAVKLSTNVPVTWWIYPIYSVSQSEEGFERVYQGSSIVACFSAHQAQADQPFEISFNSRAL